MERIVKASLKKAVVTLEKSVNQFSSQINTCSLKIDSKYFSKDYCNGINITICDKHKDVFEKIRLIKGPVIYWFEVQSPEELSERVREKYIVYRDKVRGNYKHPEYRNTASFNKKLSPDSKALYVGKVEKNFWGRLVTHLGYSQSEKTAGMQLFHWFDPKELGEITLNYIVFDDDMKYLISVLEKELAKELKPIIGRY